MFKLIGIAVVLAVIQISESAPVYQFLPPREGYIPVYIRLGDTPLDEINPELALAFHESNIRTRNVNDLDEQMVNDAPSNDDLSESDEDIKEKDKVTIQKDGASEEETKPQKPTKPSNSEPDSDEEVEKKVSNNEKDSEENKEETDSEEERSQPKVTKKDEQSSEEIVITSTTNKSESDDDSSEEVTKSKRDVPAVPAPTTELTTSDNISSEEKDDEVTKPKPNISNESKSSEES